jgi:hypothetical protein
VKRLIELVILQHRRLFMSRSRQKTGVVVLHCDKSHTLTELRRRFSKGASFIVSGKRRSSMSFRGRPVKLTCITREVILSDKRGRQSFDPPHLISIILGASNDSV